MNTRLKDDWHSNYDSFEALIGEENSIDSRSVWLTVPTSKIKIFPITGKFAEEEEEYEKVGRGGKKTLAKRTINVFEDIVCPNKYYDDLINNIDIEALRDTIENGTQLGMSFRTEDGDKYTYPVRETAVKGMFDRAKIGGEVFGIMSVQDKADILNTCLGYYPNKTTQVLVRDEKITAVCSGDSGQYSIISTNELLAALDNGLRNKFGIAKFRSAIKSHSLTAVEYTLPDSKDLLDEYIEKLKEAGYDKSADKLYPGIKFSTSDTGISVARCSAYLYGNGAPVTMGTALEVEHRRGNTVDDFIKELEGLFSRYGDNLRKLIKLMDIEIEYPYSCMERLCKKLKMPKAASYEALQQLDMAYGDEPCSAHDIYMQMQEIPFICRTAENPLPPLKIFEIEENLGKALSVHWKDFDIEKRCDW